MRRGLVTWSRVEVPVGVLKARVARVRAALAARELDALAVYTNPSRTAGVSWLTGFVPYWSESLLVVPVERDPVLITAMTHRVRDWIALNSHVARVANHPRIGEEAGRLIAGWKTNAAVAVVDMSMLPGQLSAGLSAADHRLVDGTDLFAALRNPADPAELALAYRAAQLAHTALAAAHPDMTDAAALIGRIEAVARGGGAEEIYVALAPDLSQRRTLSRIEGTAALADVFAVRVSLAYKGVWVRMTRTLARRQDDAMRIEAGVESFAASVLDLPATSTVARSDGWLVEGCRTLQPLEALAGTRVADPLAIPAGGVVSVSLSFEQHGFPVLIGAPVLIGSFGLPSAALVIPRWDDDIG